MGRPPTRSGGERGPAALTTPRLTLTPVTPADGDSLHALWTEEPVRRYLWDGEVIPRARTDEVIAESQRLHGESGHGLWLARGRSDPAVIGFGGFWYFRDPPVLELLFGVSDRLWGRGYATEIAEALVRHGCDVLRMPRVAASADAPNVASLKVLRRIGFREIRRATVNGLDTVFFEVQAER